MTEITKRMVIYCIVKLEITGEDLQEKVGFCKENHIGGKGTQSARREITTCILARKDSKEQSVMEELKRYNTVSKEEELGRTLQCGLKIVPQSIKDKRPS